MDKQMRVEWHAWRAACEELHALGYDINEERFKPFVLALQRWGAELSLLRAGQKATIGSSALVRAREQYPDKTMARRIDEQDARRAPEKADPPTSRR